MPDRSSPASRRTLFALIAFPLAKLALHLAVGRGYGYHGDELYYLVCADRLDWGYVDHPPLSILILAVTRAIAGSGVAAIRIVPAGAGALTVLLIGLMARRLGGGAFAVSLAMLAAIAAPFYLALDSYFSMNALDLLFWATAAWLFIRILQGTPPSADAPPERWTAPLHGDERLWLLLGVLMGAGLQNKISVLWLGGGLVAGLLATTWRSVLRTRGPWLAAAAAFVIFVPQIAWQVAHRFPTIAFVRGSAENRPSTTVPSFLGAELDGMLRIAAPVWIAGIVFFFVMPRGRKFRALGWAWLAVFALLALSPATRPYYAAASYTWLLAGGAVAIELALRPTWTYWIRGLLLAAIAIGGILSAPVVLPILPQETIAAYSERTGAGRRPENRVGMGRLPVFLGQMSGLDEYVDQIAAVYDRLPAAERDRANILVAYYAVASAVDILGRARGLPAASSTDTNFYLWGPGGSWDGPIITLGYSDDVLRELFTRVEAVSRTHCNYCIDTPHTISVVRGPRVPVDELWRRLKASK